MIILWIMIGFQLIAWGWFSVKGGKLSDKQFLVFTVGMLAGQTGAGIETYMTGAWGAFVVQVYFFFFTALAGYKRWRLVKLRDELEYVEWKIKVVTEKTTKAANETDYFKHLKTTRDNLKKELGLT